MSTETNLDGGEKISDSGSRNRRAWAAIKLGVATIFSRLLGLVRELLMAKYFGAGAATDAFVVAYRIPNLLRDLLAEGALSSAFIPAFARAQNQGQGDAKVLALKMIILLSVISGGVAILFFYFSQPLVLMFAPSYAQNPEQLQLAAELTAIMSSYLFCASLTALMMAVLNSLGKFFVPALSPVLFNIVSIFFIIFAFDFFQSRGEHPIRAAAYGVMVGGVGQLLLQLIPLWIGFFRGAWKLKLRPFFDKSLVGIFLNLGPGVIGVAATQINLFFSTIIATSCGEGAVSWLNYAFRFFQLPIGVIGVSIAGANIVYFSKAAASGDQTKSKEILLGSYNQSWYLQVLAMALLLPVSFEVIRLVFIRGSFTWSDGEQTAKALQLYLLGLPFYGLYKLFSPTFYALKRPMIPVFTSVVGIVLNLTIALKFAPLYGHLALAVSVSLSIAVNVALQIFFLRKYAPYLVDSSLVTAPLKSVGAGILVCLACAYGHKKILDFGENVLAQVFSLGLSFGFGILLYLAILLILGESAMTKTIFCRLRLLKK